jgi:hypothetical protein
MNFSQQRKLFEPELARPVTLIGAGAVGSHIASQLCRSGVTDLTVYDDDSIDSHNIPPSLYGLSDFGAYKVDALADILLRDTGVVIKKERRKYAGGKLRGAIIACVDSMEARQLIWDNALRNPFVEILIDTRIAWEFWQVFSVKPCREGDIHFYEQFLAYQSEDAARQSCGTHGIIYVSSAVATEAVTGLLKFWEDGKTQIHIERVCGSPIFINAKE